MALKRDSQISPTRFAGVQKLYRKIGYGYFIAISIGFVGSLTGMLIADYYQGKSVEKMWDAQTQSQLLQDFETTASDLQLYATRLAVLVEQPTVPISLPQPSQAQSLEAYVGSLQSQRRAIERFLDQEPSWVAANATVIRELIQVYTDELETCITILQNYLDGGNSGDTSSLEDPASTKLRAIAVGETANRIDQLHEELQGLVATARTQELQAGNAMEAAQGFEKLMVTVSMLISAAIASIIAWRTSRAIAEPIEKVTDVARKVAENSDFSLRVHIAAEDEIGTLAESLNHLIQQIQIQTDDLQNTAQQAQTQAHELEKTLKTLQQAQVKLIQTEKMSSLGQMVAGIAHEINNPVSFIYGNLDYAKRYVNDLFYLLGVYQKAIPNPPEAVNQCQEAIEYEFLQEDLPKLLTSLEIGAERIRSIVLSLRIFSRLNEADIKPVNLNNSIDSTLVILNHRLKEQPKRPEIKLSKNYGELPPVECYAGQINQVFMNILANAIDALEEKWFKLQPTQSDWQPTIDISTQISSDRNISITIHDNGPGIPLKAQQKIFDPFFTTKAVGKGTGLGMSISYEIVVDKHNGKLTVDSNPTEGTTFVIQLPQTLRRVTPEPQLATPVSSADVN